MADGLVLCRAGAREAGTDYRLSWGRRRVVLYEDEGTNYNFENGGVCDDPPDSQWKDEPDSWFLSWKNQRGKLPGMREAVYETVIIKG